MVWAVWFGFIFYKLVDGTANIVLQIIQTGTWQIELVWQFLPLFGMFAFGYILVMNDIKPETKRYKEFFINLLEVDLVNIVNRDRIFGMTESQIIKSLFLLTFVALLGLIIYNLLR